MATRIGLRELRQHASRWVERAEAGERIEVTRRGRLVAILTGATASADRLAELEARGRLRRATRDELPEPVVHAGSTVSSALAELRDEERG